MTITLGPGWPIPSDQRSVLSREVPNVFSGFNEGLRHLSELWTQPFKALGLQPRSSPQDFILSQEADNYLLVHGNGMTSESMSKIGEELGKSGNVLYAPEFPWRNTGPMEDSAEALVEKIMDIRSQGLIGPIIIVGHSNGGNIGVYAAHLIATNKRVNQILGGTSDIEVFALGTPFGGASFPNQGMAEFLSYACRQATQLGGFLKNKGVGNVPIRVTAIISSEDEYVSEAHQILGADGADEVNVIVSKGRHMHHIQQCASETAALILENKRRVISEPISAALPIEMYHRAEELEAA